MVVPHILIWMSKHPVGSEILRKQNRKVDVKTMAYDMGEKIVDQKSSFF